MISYTLSTLQR